MLSFCDYAQITNLFFHYLMNDIEYEKENVIQLYV